MKKVLFLFAAVLATAFVSCDKEDNAPLDTMATVGLSADISAKGGIFPGLNNPNGRDFTNEAFVSTISVVLTPAPDTDPAAPRHNENSDLSETISLTGDTADVVAAIDAMLFHVEAGRYSYAITISGNAAGIVTASSGLEITSAATGTFTVGVGLNYAIPANLAPTRAFVSLDYIEAGDASNVWDLTGSLYRDIAVDQEIVDSATLTGTTEGANNGFNGYILPAALTHDFVVESSAGLGGDVTVNPFASGSPVRGSGIDAGKYYDIDVTFDAATLSVVTTLADFASGGTITP